MEHCPNCGTNLLTPDEQSRLIKISEAEHQCPNCDARFPRRSVFRDYNRYPRKEKE